jgi:hypothetical protein
MKVIFVKYKGNWWVLGYNEFEMEDFKQEEKGFLFLEKRYWGVK